MREDATADGLRRYYRDHSRRMRPRLAFAVIVGPGYGVVFDWWGGLTIPLVVFVAEMLEARLARRILERPIAPEEVAPLHRRSVAQSGVYAAAISLIITLIWTRDAEAAPLLAVVCALSMVFDAGFLLSTNRAATLVKIGSYAAAIGGNVLIDMLRYGAGEETVVQTFAILTLAYCVLVFVMDVRGARARHARIAADLVERGEALQRVVAQLTEKERAVRRLALAAKHASDSIIITDARGRIEWVNTGFTAATGLSLSDVAGRDRRSVVAPPIPDPVLVARIDAALEAQRAIRVQARLVRRRARLVWHDMSLTPIFDADGGLTHWVAVEHDISELKAREAELARSQAEASRLALVAEHARDAIVIYSPEGRIEWINAGFVAQSGYALSEALGLPVGSLIDAGTDPGVLDAVRGAMAEERPVRAEVRCVRKDGTRFWCEASMSPVHGLDGRLTHYISVERDISELKARETELAEKERENRRLASVTQHATDSIMLAGVDGCVEWVNASFVAESGWALGDVAGRRVQTFVAPQNDPAALDGLRKAVRDEKAFRSELLVIRPGGLVWHDVIATPIYGEHGTLRHWVIVERDITKAKAREAELAEAQRAAEGAAEAKSSFLATMSHEIRTPMNGIIGTADLLAETALDEDQSRLLRTIASSSEALLRIINDILDLSKLEAGRMEIEAEPFEPFDLADLCAQLMRPLADRKGLAMEVVVGDDASIPLMGDPGRMRQILLNLLGNAIKFTEAGSVTLSAEVEAAGPRSRRLRLAVRDTGIGIAPDRLEGVFDAFTQADGTITRRFGGTGLGLSISRRLAEAMGGEMAATSRPGEGSEFSLTLELPLAETAPPPMTVIEGSGPAGPMPGAGGLALVPAPEGVGANGPPLVLVVEDNATNRFLVERMLTVSGYRCAHAEDGAAGVERCAGLDPDAVVMDVSMPVMDGFEATRRIREAEVRGGRPPRPILALTANVHESDRERGAEAGVTRFLTKPIRKAELQAAVQEALAPRDAAGAEGLRAAP